MIVVSDTGPLISMMKAGQFNLLHLLYQEIIIPDAVFAELTVNENYPEEAETIRSSTFVKTVSVTDRRAVEILQRVSGLDLGESEAIVCADDRKADVLLMEEEAGRRAARAMGLHVRGSIGILLLGFDSGFITSQDVIKAADRMMASNRRISKELYDYMKNYVNRPDEHTTANR